MSDEYKQILYLLPESYQHMFEMASLSVLAECWMLNPVCGAFCSPVEQKNPLLQLKQPSAGRTKRRYKRRNASPAKKGPSPLKRLHPGTSPAKSSPSKVPPPAFRLKDDPSGLKVTCESFFFSSPNQAWALIVLFVCLYKNKNFLLLPWHEGNGYKTLSFHSLLCPTDGEWSILVVHEARCARGALQIHPPPCAHLGWSLWADWYQDPATRMGHNHLG